MSKLKTPDFSDSETKFKYMLFGGIGLILILFIISVIVPVFSNPKFCGETCHSQNPEYESWGKSAHSKITCDACHVQPGILGLIKDKIGNKPVEIFGELTNQYEKPINHDSRLSQEEMMNDACLRCHSPLTRKFTTNKILKIESAHIKHLEEGVRCTYCHNRVAHDIAGYTNYLTMKGCSRCHSLKPGGRAPGTCETCHPPDFVAKKPPSHLVPNWAPPRDFVKVTAKYEHPAKAKEDISYCLMCHDEEKFCTTCHRTQMPHQRQWPDRHGRDAFISITNEGKFFCEKCHNLSSFCSGCHKGVMYPHPSPWAPVHGKKAKELGKQACTFCHREDLCTSCHGEIKMPHDKNWLGQHFTYVRERSADNCLNCHAGKECEQCHSVHKIHPQHTIYDFSKFQ
jgi:hypothetical protein